MKIIALVPVKNESWILPAYFSSVKKIADEIIALDDHSTDASRKILQENSALVILSPQSEKVDMSEKRKILLVEGRKRGGTHFIWLDADETFSANFIESGKKIISELKPGEKMSLRWVHLWKSTTLYRDDASVFGHVYKDFIVCDSPELSFEKKFLSENRTPGPNAHVVKLDESQGVVLHFQFAAWERTQWKQAWYRCVELIDGSRSARRINNTYSNTLETKVVSTKSVPEKWLSGITLPDISNASYLWYKEAIIGWFGSYGIAFFEPLEIWHIAELRSMFVEKIGRQPRPHVYAKFFIELNNVKNKIKNSFLS